MEQRKDKSKRKFDWKLLLVLVIAPFIIVLLPFLLIAYFIFLALLHILIWLVWSTRGIRLLYVYSNSPNWQEYIEQNILPRLPSSAIVLNWSERKEWQFNLATFVVRHYGGYRDFNPMALVIRPFRRVKVFRFFKPFKDFKNGKPEVLHQLESEFFIILNIPH